MYSLQICKNTDHAVYDIGAAPAAKTRKMWCSSEGNLLKVVSSRQERWIEQVTKQWLWIHGNRGQTAEKGNRHLYVVHNHLCFCRFRQSVASTWAIEIALDFLGWFSIEMGMFGRKIVQGTRWINTTDITTTCALNSTLQHCFELRGWNCMSGEGMLCWMEGLHGVD